METVRCVGGDGTGAETRGHGRAGRRGQRGRRWPRREVLRWIS